MRATLAGLTLFAAAPFVAAQAAANVNDQIEKAWKDREEKVRTASFEIRLTGTYFKGGLSAYPGTSVPAGKVVPAADTPVAARLRFVLGGMNCRVEEEGKLWNGSEFRDDVRQVTIMGKDGYKRLEIGRLKAPQGRIDDKDAYFFATGDEYRPLVRWCRAYSRTMRSFRVDDLQPTSVVSVIGGRTCRQFILPRVGTDRSIYWLDPDREWLVVREEYVAPNGGSTRLDIEYEPEPNCEWVPKSWMFRDNLAPHQAVAVQHYSVTAFSVNMPIPSTEFEITFPLGTEVSDNRTQGPDRYHTVTSPFTETVAPSSRSRPLWAYGAASVLGALLIVCVAAYVVRRNRSAPA